MTASRERDAWGNVVAASGTLAGPFGFVGGEGYRQDGDSGLMLLGARYYDPSVGRFISRDPLRLGAGDPCLYRYAANSPNNGTDPSGYFLIAVAVAVAGIALVEALACAVLVVIILVAVVIIVDTIFNKWKWPTPTYRPPGNPQTRPKPGNDVGRPTWDPKVPPLAPPRLPIEEWSRAGKMFPDWPGPLDPQGDNTEGPDNPWGADPGPPLPF